MRVTAFLVLPTIVMAFAVGECVIHPKDYPLDRRDSSNGADGGQASGTGGRQEGGAPGGSGGSGASSGNGGSTATGGSAGAATPDRVRLIDSSVAGTAKLDADAGSPSLTLSHVLHNDAGHGRLVLAAVAAQGNSGAYATPSDVRYDGVQAIPAHTVWSGSQAWSGIYFWADGALPARAGTYAVVVTNTKPYAFAVAANVFEFVGVDPNVPFATTGGGPGANCCCDDPSDSVNISSGAWIISVVGVFGSGAGVPLSGQTETYSNTSGSFGIAAGYRGPETSSGSATIAWDMVSCNATAQTLVVIGP